MELVVRLEKKLKEFTLRAGLRLTDGVTGLMGSSGSGKSMLLKCIAGLERPDSGYIALDGRVLFDSSAGIDLPPQQRSTGYLFQSCALFPNMSVRDNVLCVLQARGLGKEQGRQAAGMLLRRFQLAELADRYPRQLSGGQKQRTALARLLAAEPKVILLDEPFSALDADLKDAMQRSLQELLAEFGGISVLVSHDRREVLLLSGSRYTISRGEISRE